MGREIDKFNSEDPTPKKIVKGSSTDGGREQFKKILERAKELGNERKAANPFKDKSTPEKPKELIGHIKEMNREAKERYGDITEEPPTQKKTIYKESHRRNTRQYT